MTAKPVLVKPCFASEFDPLAALWVTRLSLIFSAILRQLIDGGYVEELRQIIGISPCDAPIPRNALKALLKTRAAEFEQWPQRETVLTRNVALLSDLLGLSPLQGKILTFAALSKQHAYLQATLNEIRTPSIDTLIKLLCVALSTRDAELRKAIHPDGPLFGPRVVSIEPNEIGFDIHLDMPPGLRTALFGTADNLEMLMSAFLERAPRPGLKAEAFAHLRPETELLTAYLASTGGQPVPGINILIYGVPGTGKTEYVRWLARHQGKSLYQVRASDDQGKAISGQNRLAFFQLSQRFLQNAKDVLVLFDEIEDVFPNSEQPFPFLRSREAPAGKLFINRLLENNPVPTFWLSNEVGQIDRAYLRRFDFSFEMGIPPIAVRRGILHQYLRGYAITDATLSYLAQQEQLSPAQIEKAAKVLKLSGETTKNQEATLLRVIENSMALLDQDKNDALVNLADGAYQLDYLNPDCDLGALVTQLKRAPKSVGALCFYGAPGTGKTALAHYLARAIDLPLHVRRASDLLSPYVGETEQKIAGMFKQARQDGALLLLDEADSFLSQRKSAKNTWEVTAVNEMLTQMERFEGLFICSTNLMERLDEASLRRFALKIKFDFLKPEQRWRLFLAHAQKFRRTQEAKIRPALDRLNNLTPGDFATVRRQAALLNLPLTTDALLQCLQQECLSKGESSPRPIGFIHAQ
jgi:SpoVK/Ycf46/Vps4 family AAA+-type ATPase